MANEIQVIFSELAKGIQNSGIFDLVGILLAIIIVSALGIGVIIAVAKAVKKGREFVGSTGHIGTMKLSIRKESYIIGNVNINKSFLTEEILERMKRIPQIQKDPVKVQGIMDLQQLWKDGILYAYDMRVLDSFKTELPDKDILILSPTMLEDKKIHWQDEKGEWSLSGSASSMFRRYPMNVQCSEHTEHFDIIDIHKRKKRVYVLVTFSDTENQKLMSSKNGTVVKDILRGRQVFVNMINLPNKEAMAKLAVYIPSLDELYTELEIRNDKLKNVEEQRDEYNKFADDQKTVIQGLNARLKSKMMFGYDRPVIPIPPKSLYAIAIAGIVAGFASAKLSMIPELARYQGLEYLFLIVTVVIVAGVIKFFDKKSPSEKMGLEKPSDRI